MKELLLVAMIPALMSEYLIIKYAHIHSSVDMMLLSFVLGVIFMFMAIGLRDV